MRLKILLLVILTLPICNAMEGQESEVINSKIDEFTSRLFIDDEPGAVIHVSSYGNSVYEKGFGVSNIVTQEPNSPDIAFAIGSLSKQFTAASIFILLENGMLNIDDPISKYLEVGGHHKGIRIHHLLTHSSGIPDLFSISAWRDDLSTDLTLHETFDIIMKEDLDFPPGEKTSYSNSGYFLLGLIVKVISKQCLNDYIAENILLPLGMMTTTFIEDPDLNIQIATGYEIVADSIVEPFYVSKTRFFGGGSIITTVNDLNKWDEALYTNKILNRQARELMFEPLILNNGDTSNFACGWNIGTYQGKRIYGHGGGINGYVCQTYRIPEEHLFVAVLSNRLDRSTAHPISSVAQNIVSILLDDEGYREEHQYIVLTSTELEQYTGAYLLPNGTERFIILENDKLYYKINAENKAEIHPLSRNKFKGGKSSTIVFSFSESGNILEFELHTGRGKPIIGVKQMSN